MKRTVKYLVITFFAAILLQGCGKDLSLQRYFVENQENINFVTQDIPLSMIGVDTANFTQAQTDAYNSVNRLNFLGFKLNKNNIADYNTELEKVKTILNQSEYNSLIEFNDKGNKVVVKYIGDDYQADEVVVFGSSQQIGFGIVRVLGNDMDPEKMLTLIKAMDHANINKDQINSIMDFFN